VPPELIIPSSDNKVACDTILTSGLQQATGTAASDSLHSHMCACLAASGSHVQFHSMKGYTQRLALQVRHTQSPCHPPDSWSCSTACLWLNVPRSTSCPDRRTWLPSDSSVAKASASAVAQSTPWPGGVGAGQSQYFSKAAYGSIYSLCCTTA
jgi:hypothetical protein